MDINKSILYNTELNSSEKLLLLLINDKGGTELSSEFFMKQLMCSENELNIIIESLINRDYLNVIDNKLEEEEENIKIIKNTNDYKKLRLKELTDNDYENNIDKLHDLIDEPINDRQARIILNMASNDVELIKLKYKEAKKSQYSDKIGVLLKLLQTQKYEYKTKKKVAKSQINYGKISKLKNYQNNI
ncbi:hypothetical protein QUF55_00475 [Clostridiaceae bacterium HSG29]|nr:hypothetical protein [Clostridiaceae bacterium HSG29]